MGDYITTYTGIHIDPLQPEPQQIEIRDIAHALAFLCRGNGHVKTFWSVGQHCICCALEAEARGLSGRLVRACLLHDAGECYLSDVPRPFKKSLPEYMETEEFLLNMIYMKYLGSVLTDEEQRILKEIDDDMLYYDLKVLLDSEPEREDPKIHIRIDYSEKSFREVESEYLRIFQRTEPDQS